uniref:Uncharacterized protein n=1 Tax=Picea sitchensis TaxID=3332 RepID=B8LQE8_PICSI|nr:unknown [Picea sitchensis]
MGQHDPWQNREWNGFCGTGCTRLSWIKSLLIKTKLCTSEGH